jgi:hypothetical protein
MSNVLSTEQNLLSKLREGYILVPPPSSAAKDVSKDDKLRKPLPLPDGFIPGSLSAPSPPPSILRQLLDPKLTSLTSEFRNSARLELARSLGGPSGDISGRKRAYQFLATALPDASTSVNVSFARVATGGTSNQRLTSTIRAHKLVIKATVSRFIVNPSNAGVQIEMPNLCVCVFRDKIPTSPGITPTVWGTDTNPPGGTDTVLSRMSLGGAYNAVAVENPTYSCAYHIYRCEHHALNSASGTYSGGGTIYDPHAKAWNYQWDIPLYGVQIVYDPTNPSDTIPLINDIYFSITTDIVSYTGYGYSDSMNMIGYLVFEDAQDDL